MFKRKNVMYVLYKAICVVFIRFLSYESKGSVRKNICSYFVSLRQGRGGGPVRHTTDIILHYVKLRLWFRRLWFLICRLVSLLLPDVVGGRYFTHLSDFRWWLSILHFQNVSCELNLTSCTKILKLQKSVFPFVFSPNWWFENFMFFLVLRWG